MRIHDTDCAQFAISLDIRGKESARFIAAGTIIAEFLCSNTH